MKNRDRKIFNLFARKIKERFGDVQTWAYGSRVMGKAGKYSDLDVCVVLDRIDDSIDREIMRIAWEVGFDHGLMISTLTYSREEFDHGPCSESTVVETIRREGVPA
jgi:predicted nucleotidyltransferase